MNKTAIYELKKEKQLFIALLLLSILVSVAIIGQAYGMAYLVDRSFLRKEDLELLTPAFIFTTVTILARVFFGYFQERTAQKLALRTKATLRRRIAKHMMALGPMAEERHGEVVHILTDGLDNVESYIARYLPQMGYAITIPLFMAIAMMGAVPWVGIILLITYPLIPFFMILIGKKAGKMNEEQWDRMSFLSGHFLDVLRGLSTLKVFNLSEEQGFVIARLAGEFRDSTLKVLRVAFLSSFVLELVSTISTAIIAVYTGVALLYGEIAFFPAFFILLLAPEFYKPLRDLGAAFHTGMAGEVALRKSDAFLSIPVQEPLDGDVSISSAIETLSVEHLSYSYSNANKKALDDISFTLEKGDRLMIVGESGAGKSTLAYMLMRLLVPNEGKIHFTTQGDSYALEEVTGESWRREIALLPQKPYLFQGTIASNIAFGIEDASREDIIEAAKKAEAHQFIMEDPEGYDRVLGEGGLGVSGGEAQRIAIARAFLRKSSVLILDEISAHLDVETEKELSRGLERLMDNKIVILIGHRMETLHWANRVMVMRNGRAVEVGEKEELLARASYLEALVEKGGLYHG